MNNHSNQTILVTGGSSGIGYNIVDLLAKEDYQVITTARNEDDLEHLNSQKNVSAIKMELRDKQSIVNLIQYFENQDLNLDVLINNAGVYRTGLTLSMNEEEINQIFTINVFGWMQITRQALPLLIESEGTIINISSDEGLVTTPYSTVYSMTKHAIEAYSKGIAEELKQFNIDVVVLEPGNIGTEILDNALKKLPSLKEIPTFLQDQYQEFLDNKPDSSNFKDESRSPNLIARRILEIVETKDRKFRYFEGNSNETEYVIKELMERIREINTTSNYSFTNEELAEIFNTIIDLGL